MTVTLAEILSLILIVGLHWKYVTLWYGGSGGFKGYWSSWSEDSAEKKLAKVLLGISFVLALTAALVESPLYFFAPACLALMAHLLLLAFHRE